MVTEIVRYLTRFWVNFGMIFLENTTPTPIDTDRLDAIADTLTQRDIELILCDDPAMTTLNREHRGIDRPTDVLSFPLLGDHGHLPLGTIAVSLDRVREQARTFGHRPVDELALLFMHGLLHLLGYDHEKDTGQMRDREQALIAQFGLPQSLIVRTEDA